MRSLVRNALERWRGDAQDDGLVEMPGEHADRNPAAMPGLRPRRPDDIGSCIRLLNVVHLEDGYPVYWPESPRTWLAGPDVLDAYVVTRHREILGHVATVTVGQDARSALHWRELTGLEPSHLGSVSKLFVRRRVRREGVGAALLAAATEAVEARGLVPVLDVVSNGADAVRLYDASGWRLLATYPWGSSDDDLHIHFYRGPR